MLSTSIIQSIITLIILLSACACASVTSGYLTAWLLKKMGDSTAEDLGFLSFDIRVHGNLLGFICILLFGLGWKTSVPVNPLAFTGPYQKIRTLIAYSLAPLVSIYLAIITLLITIIFLGPAIFMSSGSKLLAFGSVPIRSFISGTSPHYSSLALLIGLFLSATVIFNCFMAFIDIIFGIISACVALLYSRSTGEVDDSYHFFMIRIIVPLVLMLLFGNKIFIFLLWVIQTAAYTIATFLGSLL